MTTNKRHGGWIILLTLLSALVLTIIPIPSWAEGSRPEWVLLILIYWSMALPHRVGVGIAWFMGLTLDVLKGSLLGLHGFGLAIIIYLILKLHRRVRVFPLWQQALSLLPLLALNQLVMLWINGVLGNPGSDWYYWLPSLIGMLLWPLLFVALRGLRRHFRVS